jgi:hypothetical protein
MKNYLLIAIIAVIFSACSSNDAEPQKYEIELNQSVKLECNYIPEHGGTFFVVNNSSLSNLSIAIFFEDDIKYIVPLEAHERREIGSMMGGLMPYAKVKVFDQSKLIDFKEDTKNNNGLISVYQKK